VTDDRRERAERFLKIVRVAPPDPTGPREGSIGDTIARGLRARGVRVNKIHGNGYQDRGLPDWLARLEGRMVWIETKSGHRRLSRHQREFRRQEHENGTPVMVVRPSDFRRPPIAGCGRQTPLDPIEAAHAILVFGLDPKRVIAIVEREWS